MSGTPVESRSERHGTCTAVADAVLVRKEESASDGDSDGDPSSNLEPAAVGLHGSDVATNTNGKRVLVDAAVAKRVAMIPTLDGGDTELCPAPAFAVNENLVSPPSLATTLADLLTRHAGHRPSHHALAFILEVFKHDCPPNQWCYNEHGFWGESHEIEFHNSGQVFCHACTEPCPGCRSRRVVGWGCPDCERSP